MLKPGNNSVAQSVATDSSNSSSSSTQSYTDTSSVTSFQHSSTSISSSLNQSSHAAYKSPDDAGSSGAGTAVAIIISLVVVASVIIFSYLYLRKKGKLTKLPCWKPVTRSRKSSTSSSRRALDDQEDMEIAVRRKRGGNPDEMFTINDFDNNADPAKEEYYYDEVFGQSQFEDERTNNALKHLYSDCDPLPTGEMEDIDFDSLDNRLDDVLDSDRNTAA